MNVALKKYVIKLNGSTYEVEMGEVPGGQSVAVSSGTASAKGLPLAGEETLKAPVASGGEPIVAPMPGNIINVLVKAGETVKKGQVLLVLEAMKMENEIVSPKDGTVLSVDVTKGSTVNVGEVFMNIG